MGDYGFRISETGNDVKTCTDLKCVVTSKYANLKGSASGTGQTTVNSGTANVINIAHGLGYIPSVKLLHDAGQYFGAGQYYNVPFFAGDGFGAIYDISIFAKADSTNVTLTFYWKDWGAGASRTFNYAYYIFIDKGKL